MPRLWGGFFAIGEITAPDSRLLIQDEDTNTTYCDLLTYEICKRLGKGPDNSAGVHRIGASLIHAGRNLEFRPHIQALQSYCERCEPSFDKRKQVTVGTGYLIESLARVGLERVTQG